MALLALLRLLHVLQSLLVLVVSLRKRLTYTLPLQLTAARRLVPKHLAVLFTIDSALDLEETEISILENVEYLVRWCQVVGIEKLSLYDTKGIFYSSPQKIREIVHLQDESGAVTTDSEVDFPLTPPLSDSSRPISPINVSKGPAFKTIHFVSQTPRRSTTRTRRRKSVTKPNDSFTIYLLSSQASKESIASIARSLAARHRGQSSVDFSLSVSALSSRLEGPDGFPAPDFMIVHPLSPSTYHRAPLELYGFPPWQMRLTEIYLNRYHKRHRTWASRFIAGRKTTRQISLALTELEFREALDKFAEAEMRFGK
ncbi:hypothetical protein C8J56DRAFT_918845 [Mycena floridula]|nr:hypothetical protein C8J56DRAFT_918845 [Mycena floridula]